jgi:hypothetical protein
VNIKKDEHIFYHPVFREDNKAQLHTIKRKRKGNGNGNNNNGSTFARANSNMIGDSMMTTGGGAMPTRIIDSSQLTLIMPDIDSRFTQANFNIGS